MKITYYLDGCRTGIDYYPTTSQVKTALGNIIVDLYFNGLSDKVADYVLIRKGLKKFLVNIDTEDLEKQFMDELKEYFEPEVKETYKSV